MFMRSSAVWGLTDFSDKSDKLKAFFRTGCSIDELMEYDSGAVIYSLVPVGGFSFADIVKEQCSGGKRGVQVLSHRQWDSCIYCTGEKSPFERNVSFARPVVIGGR
jgi:hypothetical protein